MQKETIKDRLRAYASPERLKDDFYAELNNVGMANDYGFVNSSRVVVCLLKPRAEVSSIALPESYEQDKVYDYAVTRLQGSLFVVQVPVYGLVPLGGSSRVLSVSQADIYCYWRWEAVERLMK